MLSLTEFRNTKKQHQLGYQASARLIAAVCGQKEIELENCQPVEASSDDSVESLLTLSRYPDFFTNLELSPTPATLGEWATKDDVTAQAIRMRRFKVVQRVRYAVVHEPDFQQIYEHTTALKASLGHVCDLTVSDNLDCIAERAQGLSDNVWTPHLLMWLAGPYRTVGDNLVDCNYDLGRIPAELRIYLESRACIPTERLIDLAERYRYPIETMRQILLDNGWKNLGGDSWGYWAGSLLKKAELLMQFHNKPMTATDIVRAIDDEPVPAVGRVRGLRERMRQDPKFAKINVDGEFALSSWNMRIYDGIHQAITDAINTNGGSIHIGDLADQLHDWYNIKKSSVVSYATTDAYTLEDNVLTTNEPPTVYLPKDISHRDDVGIFKGLWAHEMYVRDIHLRGYSFRVIQEVAALNGVQPNDSLRVPVVLEGEEIGEASVIWRWGACNHGVDIGRLRKVLLSHNIHEGSKIALAPTRDKCLIDIR